MRSFDSIGCYFVRDRKVLCVKLDQDEERDGLLAKLRAEGGVVIDGERYQIDGVESNAVPTLRKGVEIGLRLAELLFEVEPCEPPGARSVCWCGDTNCDDHR